MGAIKRFLKKYFSIEPTIVNPFNRQSYGAKFTLKNRDEKREDKIIEIISKQLNIKTSDIYLESNLKEDLGFDSLDCIELAMTLEEEFCREIADEDVENVVTVKDICALIEISERK